MSNFTDFFPAAVGVDLQSSVKIANFTAVANEGYLVNTTSSAITVTLPSSPSLGDEVLIIDYAVTFGTNNVTLTSSDNILGSSGDYVIESNDVSVILIYTDATKGWKVKTGANEGTSAIVALLINVDYLVVAGGGSGGIIGSTATAGSGAGGAGGLRTSYGSTSGGGASAESSLSLSVLTDYTVTVGAGGASTTNGVEVTGNSGFNSVFSDIESTGGGGGGGNNSPYLATSGGSGGGGNESDGAGGSGTSEQGFAGGNGSESGNFGGGGGGAGSAGSGLTGGSGLAVSITGASVTYASGGDSNNNGSDSISNAAVNTGNGADGGGTINKNGGSGVVVLRYPGTYSISETTSPSVLTFNTTTDGSDKVTTFTAGENGTIQFS